MKVSNYCSSQLDTYVIYDFLNDVSKLDGEQQPITNSAINIRRCEYYLYVDSKI